MQQQKLLYERNSGHLMVGVFVMVAILLFGWLLIRQQGGAEGYTIIAGFNTITNVNEATSVRLRGFTVGQVERIEFRPQPPDDETYFLVEMGIEDEYPVFAGTFAEIQSSGLVGDSFINLNVSEAESAVLEAGATIEGRDAPGMKQLVATLTAMAHKLGGAGESIRRADLGYKLGRLGDSFHRVATTLDQVGASADSLLRASRDMVHGVEPEVVGVLKSVDRTLVQLQSTIGHTDSLVVSAGSDVQSSIKALRASVERLDTLLQRVDTLMLGKEEEIDRTLSNLHAASESVREISQHPWKLLIGQDHEEEEGSN